ncbi:hypothetical protein EYB25_009996 [Talaromyces marneffei]|uniref:uncharacterized protein n=1 Tax=Talaromyces marneffei TaxID=37727 RepID=UPI0012A8F3FF|nr:uncharacterized protein EYB26_009261 [Talaromyces marneffei]KAE8548202.1 hypothetical protein EYB25_009996 [Talaromyces marneffei]QGA21550.1 hypothetical protein EYB26_009261 [Talaromyces marneffei]
MSAIPTGYSPSTLSTGMSSCAIPIFEIPTDDAACGIHPTRLSNATEVLSLCCGVASVVTYAGGCAAYCLAQRQTISSLQSCFINNGGDPFCNALFNATATAAVSSASSTGASSTGTRTGTATGSSASSTSSPGAAVKTMKVSTGGVSVIALLICSTLFGALA